MKAYIVLRNADFTEGRGPMLFHSAWTDGEEAIKYVAAQGGIFGSRQHVERDKYGKFAYANGYEIIETDLVTTAAQFQEVKDNEERKAAIRKLSTRERALLGLQSED